MECTWLFIYIIHDYSLDSTYYLHDHFVTIVMNGVCSYSSASLGAPELHIVLVLLSFWNLKFGQHDRHTTRHHCVYPGLYIICTLFYCLVDAGWRVFSGAGGSKGLFCCYVVLMNEKKKKRSKGFLHFPSCILTVAVLRIYVTQPWSPVQHTMETRYEWVVDEHDRVTKDPCW